MKIKFIFFSLLVIIIVVSACSKQELQNIDTNGDILIPLIGMENMTLNNSTNQKETKIEEKINVDELRDDDQFKTDELHWTHMPITYHILNPGHMLKDCEKYESNKIRKGFDRIENATKGIVHFKEVKKQEDADIVVSCSFLEDCYKQTVDTSTKDFGYVLLGESICEHTKGLASITKNEGNKILNAEIEMIGLAGFAETKNKGVSGFFFGSCGHPTIEIHEILHIFGYDHVSDLDSIMYYLDDVSGYTAYSKGDCIGSNKEIDEWIVEDLIKTYSN